MAFVEDKTIFLDPENPGVETASYRRSTGGAATDINGQFWRTPYADAGIEGSDSTFLCPLADMPNVAHGDTLVIQEETFVVKGKSGPDEGGWIELTLELENG